MQHQMAAMGRHSGWPTLATGATAACVSAGLIRAADPWSRLFLLRPVVVVSLDPANYSLPYPAAIDIKELIDMEEVMETFQLGPNGGQQGRGEQQLFAARNAAHARQ